MKQTELDTILTAMLDAHPGISDLLFTVNRPFQVESYGELKEARIQPAVKVLTPFQTEQIALNIVRDQRHLLGHLLTHGARRLPHSRTAPRARRPSATSALAGSGTGTTSPNEPVRAAESPSRVRPLSL